MTSTLSAPALEAPPTHTARVTGALYLAVAFTGMIGFLLIRPALHDPDPAVLLANLRDHEALARVGIGLELGLVLSQAGVALWFFRLFRSVDSFAAGAIAVFGTVNAVAILSSAATLATALDYADEGVEDSGTPLLMYTLSEHLWGAGNLFFGLWLIPMGWCVLRTSVMPRLLGRLLVVGGVGYVLSGFVSYLLPDVPALAEVLVVPATIGEVWMIGYLLIRGAGRQG